MSRISTDITAVDFECPKGHPWIMDQDSSTADIRPGFQSVCEAIAVAPASGVWDILREELRLTMAAIDLKEKQLGSCWRRLQERRIVDYYMTAKAKEAKTP